MRVGPRTSLIVIERGGATGDGYGKKTSTWAPFAEVFAEVKFGTGKERREAAQTKATGTATFRVPHNDKTAATTTKDRIVFDGSAWDIHSNIGLGLRDGREITATRIV